MTTTGPGTTTDVADAVVVRVEGLSKVFPGPPEVTALQPCDFQVGAGEFVAITGPSGSGKTTLLSLLGLLDTPSAGRYVLDGLDVAELSDNDRAAVRARRIGFVFQAFHLVGYRTVLENVELGLLYHGTPKRERRQRALEVIERVGLSGRRNGLCSQLSGGEKQRVAIARTLIRKPALVLCDEPTGNLDTVNSDTILSTLEELHGEGMTVVVITHDHTVAARAQRNLQIRDGVVTEANVGVM
ncbi:MAG TPA: ABC transporter ATP-binding protein [Ilumatobacteraceae bacterium]|nr:ABC transporter ATP-binding protein [Ilumatobacteraceae bacterium]HRB02770.1 ABC transporter ATP-binding protein [Ilumatobacteraceae bacterium]